MGQPGAEAGCKQARGVDFLFISNELQFGSRVALKRVWEKRPFRMQTRLATTQPNLLPLREGFGTVDSIACFRQMDRCDQPQFLLEQIARVLRSGGLLLLFVLKTGRAALRTVALLQLPKPKRYRSLIYGGVAADARRERSKPEGAVYGQSLIVGIPSSDVAPKGEFALAYGLARPTNPELALGIGFKKRHAVRGE